MREKLGLEDTVAMMQCNRLQWFVHMLLEDVREWFKKCIDYEVEAINP